MVMEATDKIQGILSDADRTIQLLKQVKAMCSESVGCRNIGTDQDMLGLLILALTKPEGAIVQVALEAMYKLARYEENRRQIMSVDGKCDHGLYITLRHLMAHGSLVIQELARNVYDILENPSIHLGYRKPEFNTDNNKRTTGTPKKRRNSFFVGGGIGNSKMIMLHIRGMHDRDDKELLRERILRVKGVISFTIDDRRSRVTLRTKPDLKPECLADTIKTTMTMTAEQIVKDENGQERFISFKSKDMNIDKENLPDYPSDDDSLIRGEKDIEQVGKTDKSSTWEFVSSVSNFLQNSFYW